MISLLSQLEIRPVLIDIGASYAPPTIWTTIAPVSIYIGFDPDLRDLREIPDGQFYKATIIDAAVCAEDVADVTFFLTRSPYCSSTLQPDSPALSHFLFADLFEVERQVTVKATTLNQVVDRLALTTIDWLKTDSQGTDLRLFTALAPHIRSRVLAFDLEPGLIDAYLGEDSFISAHDELSRQGFWLSNLDVQRTARMRRETLAHLQKVGVRLDESLVAMSFKPTPGWCEARYLRTLDSMIQNRLGQREYVLLWVIAMLDGQVGFALDLVLQYERIFGADDTSQRLSEQSVEHLRKAMRRYQVLGTVKRILRPFAAPIRRFRSLR